MRHFDTLVRKHYYIYERYGVDATFALLYHARPLDVEELGNFVRLSDHLHQIDDNHYIIIFTFTDYSGAYKACQNLLCRLDDHFRDTESRVALDSFDTTLHSGMVLNRLQRIMDEVRKRPRVRIDNETILDGRM
ncbi:hypothetical protein WCX49_07715 [Sulfurimonas sp. HSL-1656]|uniref:hypothetical protein n=1 Tax=Thiomicrolovo subterrani TaxID=3131934 RepID=UPI0031F72990